LTLLNDNLRRRNYPSIITFAAVTYSSLVVTTVTRGPLELSVNQTWTCSQRPVLAADRPTDRIIQFNELLCMLKLDVHEW